MDNFIEIIGINNDRVLVNVNSIMWISEETDAQLGGKYTEINFTTGSVRTYEKYEKIKERIFSIGKVFLVR